MSSVIEVSTCLIDACYSCPTTTVVRTCVWEVENDADVLRLALSAFTSSVNLLTSLLRGHHISYESKEG